MHHIPIFTGLVLGLVLAGTPTSAEVPESGVVLAALAAQEERLPNLRTAMEAAQSKGLDIAYPLADVTIGELFIGFGREDVEHGRVARAEEVAREVAQLLDRAEREMELDRKVPKLGAGPIEIRDGSLWAACETADGMEHRPVFLTGYGHFSDVVEALPLLGKIGINVIQNEIGANSVVFEDGIRTDAIENRILYALNRAAANGVRLDLLISPHYFPEWTYQKWPELRIVKEDGPHHFIKNSVEAPKAREIYEQFLRTLIPVIKEHPALLSICLSNEPIYEASVVDPWRAPLWQEWMRARHGDMATLNARYGTSFGTFEEITHPEFSFTANPAMVYDAVRFNQVHFSGFHRWLVDTIHDMAPGLPCHAKVMPLVWGRYTIFWGTDPWEFAQLSQLNGNDCYFDPRGHNERWQSSWQIQNMYLDLQRSMKRVPVANTENHIIPDRHQEYVSPDHIYTALWQAAAHGQGISTTWAWGRTYDPKHDFEGLILHRAGCTAAMSRVALDLMRLSYEMAALQNVPPRVALLWSNSAQVHDSRFGGERDRIYEALNFCGVPIGFVTEEQIAAGGLDDYACLLVAGARTLLQDAVKPVEAFRARGGRLVFYGSKNFVQNEFGRPMSPLQADSVIEGRPRDEALRDRLLQELAAAGIQPEIELRTPEGKIPYGVEWRVAMFDGKMLLNVVNLTRETRRVALPGDGWHELIRDTVSNSSLELAPNQPHLLALPLAHTSH